MRDLPNLNLQNLETFPLIVEIYKKFLYIYT